MTELNDMLVKQQCRKSRKLHFGADTCNLRTAYTVWSACYDYEIVNQIN